MKLNVRKTLAVKSGLKAGGRLCNHARTALKVRSGLKAGKGKLATNHSRTVLSARSD